MALFLFFLSFFIVAFGQPGWVVSLTPVAAAIGYALCWKVLTEIRSTRRRFFIAMLWYGLVQMVQLSWMSSYEFQGYYIFLLYFLITIAIGAQFGLFALLIPKNGSLSFSRILCLASFWTLMEWIRTLPLCGFTFNPTGLSLTGYVVPMQFVAIFGIFGLSFWVIMTNGAAFNLLKEKWRISSISLFLSLAFVPYLFGILHLAYHSVRLAESKTVSVALIQTGLLPSQKLPLQSRLAEFIPPLDQWERIFLNLSSVPRDSVEMIVLPEIAVPFLFDQGTYPYSMAVQSLRQAFGETILSFLPSPIYPYGQEHRIEGNIVFLVSNSFFAKSLANYFQADLIIGLEGNDLAIKRYYNGAYHFTPFSDVINHYEKRILMPLAESLPFEWCRSLANKYGILSFYTPGTDARVFAGIIPFSPSICYEETFASLMREAKLKGSEMLVNLTNDNWYPTSKLPKQHFDLARLRSIENGLPTARACNSGITAAVDALGRIVTKLGWDRDPSEWESGMLVASIPTYHYFTLFLLWGNSGIISASFLFIGFEWVRLRKRKERWGP